MINGGRTCRKEKGERRKENESEHRTLNAQPPTSNWRRDVRNPKPRTAGPPTTWVLNLNPLRRYFIPCTERSKRGSSSCRCSSPPPILPAGRIIRLLRAAITRSTISIFVLEKCSP